MNGYSPIYPHHYPLNPDEQKIKKRKCKMGGKKRTRDRYDERRSVVMFVVMFQSFSSIPSTFMGKMSGDQWKRHCINRENMKEMDKLGMEIEIYLRLELKNRQKNWEGC